MTLEIVKRTGDPEDIHKGLMNGNQDFETMHGHALNHPVMQNRMRFDTTYTIGSRLSVIENTCYIHAHTNVTRGFLNKRSINDSSNNPVRSICHATSGFQKVPIVGRIVAGKPVPVPASDFNYFDAESTVEIALGMLPEPQDFSEQLYALQVQGDSMVGDRVNDGDIVIMQPRQEARDGEMVAVWLADEDETTLKRFYREGDRIRLQPSNPTLDPIYITEGKTMEVQGVVVMIISQIGKRENDCR
jgi:repressor LexA